MENKTNVAELLKDCPKGMELYSPIFGEVYLDKIRPHLAIVVTTDKEQGDFKEEFLYDGRYGMNGECMLFPSKYRNTWEGFVPPCTFKDGDVVSTTSGYWIGITTGGESRGMVPVYCVLKCGDEFEACFDEKGKWYFDRLATGEEKQKLFDAIKDHGYKWNAKTKTLEKSVESKFKDGDIIFTHANCLKVGLGNTWISIYQENRNGGVATYIDYAEDGSDYYSNIDEDKPLLCMEKDIMRQRLATEEEKRKLFDAIKDRGYKWNAETKTLEKSVESKFKVWDRIRHKYDQFRDERTIVYCGKGGYWTSINAWIDYENQDDWELVPNKFDITSLVPFESRVLVRDYDNRIWIPTFWGKRLEDDSNCSYLTANGCYKYCIPYEGNEHLLGTTNDCDNYYKTWK